MPLKHTELTDKDPEGVLDHADRSITKEKLADNIDMHLRGFDAAWVNGLRLDLKDYGGSAMISPGGKVRSYRMFTQGKIYVVAIKLGEVVDIVPNAYVTPFHWHSPLDGHCWGLWNPGTQTIFNVETYIYEIESMPPPT